jgi:hypothetical protein
VRVRWASGKRLAALVAVGTAVVIAVVVSTVLTADPSTSSLPAGTTLDQIAGGPNYFARINPQSAWLDQHFPVGAYLEQPVTPTDVQYDVAMGNNIYWNLAGEPGGTSACPAPTGCRVNYNVIRAAGMHADAPDITAESGSETVAYAGSDEADLVYGVGDNPWNQAAQACIPKGSSCGYTVAQHFFTTKPPEYGKVAQPVPNLPVYQNNGLGVLFWETPAEANKFFSYSDILSADTYWNAYPSLGLAAQGACAILPNSAACDYGKGPGLTTVQRTLPANYGWDVSRIAQLEAKGGQSKPIVADIETGCLDTACTTPAATRAAAWQAIIAGARGILWFQQSFGGKCADSITFYDGSNPKSKLYSCQQTPGVTLHDVVANVSAVNHEITSLSSVLLSPFAENYVSVGDANASVMAKYSDGDFYVFAASGKPADPPSANQSVTFKVAGNYTGKVTVVDEDRTLNAVNGVFTDKFANEDSVHIYRIG